MIGQVSRMIKNIDIYGAQFNFYVQKETTIKTMLGGVFTLLTLGFFLFTFIVFGYDFYYKLNPNVISQEKLYTKEELYSMNNQTVTDLPIVMKMSKRISEEIYFIVDANIPYTFQEEKLYNYVKHCSEDYVLENFYPDNAAKGKEDMEKDWGFLCYNISDYKFGLHDTAGGQGSEIVNVLSIWTTRCRDREYKGFLIPCPSNYDPNLEWDDTDLEIWTKKTLYNPDDLSFPFESSWTRVARMRLSLTVVTELYIYLLETISMDDTGFILESLNKSSRFGLGSIELLDFILNSPMKSFDFTLYIGYDKFYKQYLRKYMKIQDLLAVVGGILKALMTLFQIITFPYNEHSLVDYLKNKVERTNSFKPKESLVSNQIRISEKSKLNESKSEISNQNVLKNKL